MITKITKGKQITIPSKIRKKLNIKEGAILEIEIKDGEIVIRPIEGDLEELFEEAKHTKPKFHLTAEEMDKLVEDEIL